MTQNENNSELSEWVRLAQDGDTQAFERVFHHTQALARKIAYTILPKDLVEDAIQESFILVYRKLKQLKEPEAFAGWLSRLVLHTSYRLASKNPKQDQMPSEISAKDSEKDQVLDSLVLRQALSRLPQKDRDILILRELLGLSYEEVAFALKISLGTVRSRLHSARKKLAQRLTLGQTH